VWGAANMNKAKLYKRYPISSILIYNGITIIHFFLGGIIIASTGYFWGLMGTIFGVSYFILSLIEMYIVMPLQVCKNCVYYRLENGLCISGLNLWARKIAKPGASKFFPSRAKGSFCPNNIYILTLIFPILAGVVILLIHFTVVSLIGIAVLFMLLMLRFFLMIPKLACVHCYSKFICPQAGQMGVREK
jgi:hypothetical protein